MNRLLCALFGHRYARTGVSRHELMEQGSVSLFIWRHEYQCRRCTARMWE